MMREKRDAASWLREAERYEAMAKTCLYAPQAAECKRLAALARDRAIEHPIDVAARRQNIRFG